MDALRAELPAETRVSTGSPRSSAWRGPSNGSRTCSSSPRRARPACSATHRAVRARSIAFVCFCLAASGTYFLNDALDVEADRRHPTKRIRPIAAGEVSVRTAITGGIVLLVASIGLSFAARWQLSLVVGGYLAADDALQPVAEARSGARSRVRCVGVRAAHDRRWRRGRGHDLPVVPHRRRFGVAVHGHRKTPRGDGGARRASAARIALTLAMYSAST